MVAKRYLLNESLDRIDKLLKGYQLDTADIEGGLSHIRYPIAVTKKYCMVVAKIDYHFVKREPDFKGKVYSAAFNELFHIARGTEQLCCFKASGDRVVVIYDTPNKSDVDRVIDMVGNMCGIVDIINRKCRVTPINMGFAIRVAVNYGELTFLSYGEPRMNIVADNRLIEETMGFFGASTDRVILSPIIWNNMKEDYQKFFHEVGVASLLYSGNIINTGMSNWLESQER